MKRMFYAAHTPGSPPTSQSLSLLVRLSFARWPTSFSSIRGHLTLPPSPFLIAFLSLSLESEYTYYQQPFLLSYPNTGDPAANYY